MITSTSQINNIDDLRSYVRFVLAKHLFNMLNIESTNEPTEEILGLLDFEEDALFGDGYLGMYDSGIYHLSDDADDNEIERLFINKYDLKITTDKFKEIAKTFINSSYDMIDITLIEQDGGGEGGSEYCYSVLKIGEKFFKFGYSYQSHAGFSFWGNTPVKEVHPQKVEVIKYF